MSHHYQRRAGDKNQLQRPQTDMGDGEDVVIADVGAARLETQETFTEKMIAGTGRCTSETKTWEAALLFYTRGEGPVIK